VGETGQHLFSAAAAARSSEQPWAEYVAGVGSASEANSETAFGARGAPVPGPRGCAIEVAGNCPPVLRATWHMLKKNQAHRLNASTSSHYFVIPLVQC
jgi:hypothetical protein